MMGVLIRDNSVQSIHSSKSTKNILTNKKIKNLARKRNLDYDPFERKINMNLGSISNGELKSKVQQKESNRYDISNELYIQYLKFKKENMIED